MGMRAKAKTVNSYNEVGLWAGLMGPDGRSNENYLFYDGEIVGNYIPRDYLEKTYTAETLAKTIEDIQRTKEHNPCWLYMWVDYEMSMKKGKLVVKFGAARNGPYDRNKGDQNSANYKTIWVCPSMFWDKDYEHILKKIGGVKHLDEDENSIGGDRDELYAIDNATALFNFQKIVEKECGVAKHSYESRPLYLDSLGVIDEIMNIKTNAALPCFVLDIAPRGGKSLIGCCLAKALPCRMVMFTSYINTSCKSIRDIILHVKGFEHCMWVNQDEADVTLKEIDDWIRADERNWVMYYGSLTGTDAKFNQRMNVARKFLKKNPDIKSIVIVDEADFGAKTKKQKTKLREMVTWGDCLATFAMTGTNAMSAANLFKDEDPDGIVTRTIHDLLATAAKNSAELKNHR